MSLNWATVLQSVISGAVVSWPGIAVGLWFSHRKIKAHITSVTAAQTKALKDSSDEGEAKD